MIPNTVRGIVEFLQWFNVQLEQFDEHKFRHGYADG